MSIKSIQVPVSEAVYEAIRRRALALGHRSVREYVAEVLAQLAADAQPEGGAS